MQWLHVAERGCQGVHSLGNAYKLRDDFIGGAAAIRFAP